jgi:bifunctional ADP-heptose synthase (sugar kinase/adenylyltransferase)
MPNFAPKVIVIGEKAIDIFQYIDVTRVNPEAPSLVGVPVSMEVKGGMAENVYNNLLSLGLKQSEACFISNPTAIVKKRYVDAKSNYIIFRFDENDDVIEKQHEYFCGDTLKALEKLIVGCKTVKLICISDYRKGYIDEYWVEQVTSMAHKHGIKVALDSKRILSNWSKEVDFVKINRKEYEDNLRVNKNPELFCRNLFVTLGSEGIWWVNQNRKFPTKKVELRDSVGCGDAVLAGFAIKYIEEENIEESIKYANLVGATKATKKGTYAVKKNEVLA